MGIHSLSLGLLYANRKGYEQAESIAKSALRGFDNLNIQGCPEKRRPTTYLESGHFKWVERILQLIAFRPQKSD